MCLRKGRRRALGSEYSAGIEFGIIIVISLVPLIALPVAQSE